MKDVYSPYKATQFPDHLSALKQGWTIPPIHLNIDLSSYCSQDCTFCYRNNLELGGVRRELTSSFLSNETLDRLVTEIPKAGVRGVELTGFYGEPTMHPKFNEFVLGLRCNGISVGLITNGDFLHKINANDFSYIRVSISSLKQELHDKIRKGKNIQLILDSLEKINKEKKDTVTGFGFTIDDYNYTEVFAVCKKAEEIGCANIRFTPVWKDDMEYWRNFEESALFQVGRARQEFKLKIIGPEIYAKMYRGKKNYKTCNYAYFTMNITSDGLCYPCCVTRGVKWWDFGNINEQSLDEIVWGYQRRNLIKNIKLPVE